MSVESLNTFYYTIDWLHVVSVKSGKNKNKEISKKYIYYSCRECREFNCQGQGALLGKIIKINRILSVASFLSKI